MSERVQRPWWEALEFTAIILCEPRSSGGLSSLTALTSLATSPAQRRDWRSRSQPYSVIFSKFDRFKTSASGA